MITSETNSALLSVEFDWADTLATKKVSETQEAFKYDPRQLARGADGTEVTYPYRVIDTKLRVRGAGRTMKVRYESTDGKDFILLGHSIFGMTRSDSEGNK